MQQIIVRSFRLRWHFFIVYVYMCVYVCVDICLPVSVNGTLESLQVLAKLDFLSSRVSFREEDSLNFEEYNRKRSDLVVSMIKDDQYRSFLNIWKFVLSCVYPLAISNEIDLPPVSRVKR